MVNLVGAVLVGTFGLAGAFFLYRAVVEFRTAYHVLAGDPVPVREVPARSGPVEIQGTTAIIPDHGTVRSPVTDTECLAYGYEARETAPSDYGGLRNWLILDDGDGAPVFVVSDSPEHGTARRIVRRGLYETGYCLFCLSVVFVVVQASP